MPSDAHTIHASQPVTQWADDDILTELEAATDLRVKPRSLSHWRAQGTGPAYIRIGGRAVGYLRKDIQAFKQSRRFTSTSEEAARAA